MNAARRRSRHRRSKCRGQNFEHELPSRFPVRVNDATDAIRHRPQATRRAPFQGGRLLELNTLRAVPPVERPRTSRIPSWTTFHQRRKAAPGKRLPGPDLPATDRSRAMRSCRGRKSSPLRCTSSLRRASEGLVSTRSPRDMAAART